MFENSTVLGSDSGKKVRYEPIERRRNNRRNAVADRRSDNRAEDDNKSDRRQKSDRRKKK